MVILNEFRGEPPLFKFDFHMIIKDLGQERANEPRSVTRKNSKVEEKT